MISTRDGGVWVGSGKQVLHFFRGNWIENSSDEGLSGATITALCEDQRGGIWALSSNVLARFHPDADSDPARTSILSLSKTEKYIPEDGMITVRFSGKDKWRVTEPDRLLFSQKLDEGNWSSFTKSTSATLSDLSPGQHHFQACSMDRAWKRRGKSSGYGIQRDSPVVSGKPPGFGRGGGDNGRDVICDTGL